MGGPSFQLHIQQDQMEATTATTPARLTPDNGSMPLKKRRFVRPSSPVTSDSTANKLEAPMAHSNSRSQSLMRSESSVSPSMVFSRRRASLNHASPNTQQAHRHPFFHRNRGDATASYSPTSSLQSQDDSCDVPLNLSRPDTTCEIPLSRIVDRVVERMLKNDGRSESTGEDPLGFWFDHQFENNQQNNQSSPVSSGTSGRETPLHSAITATITDDAKESNDKGPSTNSRRDSPCASLVRQAPKEVAQGTTMLKETSKEEIVDMDESSTTIHLTIGLSDTIDRVIDNVYGRKSSDHNCDTKIERVNGGKEAGSQRRDSMSGCVEHRIHKASKQQLAADSCEVTSNSSDHVNSTSSEAVEHLTTATSGVASSVQQQSSSGGASGRSSPDAHAQPSGGNVSEQHELPPVSSGTSQTDIVSCADDDDANYVASTDISLETNSAATADDRSADNSCRKPTQSLVGPKRSKRRPPSIKTNNDTSTSSSEAIHQSVRKRTTAKTKTVRSRKIP